MYKLFFYGTEERDSSPVLNVRTIIEKEEIMIQIEDEDNGQEGRIFLDTDTAIVFHQELLRQIKKLKLEISKIQNHEQ
jgi:hypothetical protein